jgi:hypothetical protein
LKKAKHLIILILFFSFISCKTDEKTKEQKIDRVFEGYHVYLDEIIKSKRGVFRGLNLNSSPDSLKITEKTVPVEKSPGNLFFEYKIDSLTNYSINYTFNKDSLEEINVQINCKDVELTSYLFCDLKDYYANKLPNPTEDQGSIVYNCFEGQRKPFVVSLSDNSSPSRGVINMYIYKDK